jgi:hypothetical protein
LGGGSRRSRLGNVSIKLFSTTAADGVCEEDEDESDANYADDGEDAGYCCFVL